MSIEDKHTSLSCRVLKSEKEMFLKVISSFYEGSASEQLRAFFKDVIKKKWIKHSLSAVSLTLRKSCYNLDCRSLNFTETQGEGNITEGECLDCGTEWLITKKKKPIKTFQYPDSL